MIRASDLVGCVVRSESGNRLGRVHDLRARSTPDGIVLEGLMIGRTGIVARLVGGGDEPLSRGTVVPWESVTQLEDGLVTVREDAVG